MDPLADALVPVLADVLRTTGVTLIVKADAWSDFPVQVTAMIWQTDGSGTGVSVMSDDSGADRVVSAADQVQEIVIEVLWAEGRATTWPECSSHPGGHPLKAACRDGAPTWVCPASDPALFVIGELGDLGHLQIV